MNSFKLSSLCLPRSCVVIFHWNTTRLHNIGNKCVQIWRFHTTLHPSYLIPLFIISSTDKVYNYTYLILFSATTGTKQIILGPILYKYHPRRFLCDVHHPMVWQNNQDIPQEKEKNCLSLLSCWSTPLSSGGMERLLIAWTEEDAQWTPDNVFHHTVRNSQQNMVTVLKLLFIWGSIQWQQRTQQILHSPELQL